MAPRANPQVSSRKSPKQARSEDLVSAVLTAAIQVLRDEGAARFTTARVAERAGVSVGSLYQYFPNKAAILFRLQSDEWQQTSAMLRKILEDQTQAPTARLRTLVHAFLRSECDEADVRRALADAAPLYRDAPEAAEARGSSTRLFENFMAEALDQADAATRELAADLVRTTLSQVCGSFSESPRSDDQIAAYADALADMLCAYLDDLERKCGHA